MDIATELHVLFLSLCNSGISARVGLRAIYAIACCVRLFLVRPVSVFP